MRGVIGRRLSNRNGYFNLTCIIQPTSHFSSFSGLGRGRGINREPEPLNQGPESQSTGGFGHGTPIQSNQRFQPQQAQAASPPRPQFSPEEAGRRARSELSKGRGGRGMRGRGMRGRGGRGRGDKKQEEAEKEAISMFVGDLADGDKFAEKIGPEKMSKLAHSFEQICEKALPSPAREAYIDALDTNFAVK